MRKCLSLGLLLPALVLGGCALLGGGRSVDEASQLSPRRTTPLVVPSTWTLPPPGQSAAAGQAR